MPYGSTGGVWGAITGTLSGQADLNAALALKAPLASPAFTTQISIGTDVILSRGGVAILNLGGADVASPVAQSIAVPNVLTGTVDMFGRSLTFNGSQGTGTGVGGGFIFRCALAAGSSGSTKNTLNTIVTIDSTGLLMASGKILKLGSAASTGLSAGALSAQTNASIVITDQNGQAYRIPCII